MKFKLSDTTFAGKIDNVISENGATLAMIGAMLGLAATVFTAFKASKDVAKAQDEYETAVKEIEASNAPDEEKKDDIKEQKSLRNFRYVMAYRYVGLSAGFCFCMMHLNNHILGGKIAGLVTALAIEKDRVKKFIKNGKEIVGEEPMKEIEDKTMSDLLDKNFNDDEYGPVSHVIDKKEPGDIYFDTATGALFQFHGTEDDLKRTLLTAENFSYRCKGISMAKYLKFLGEPMPPWASGYWGPNRPFEAHIGKRTIRGATFKSIEHRYDAADAKTAGVSL